MFSPVPRLRGAARREHATALDRLATTSIASRPGVHVDPTRLAALVDLFLVRPAQDFGLARAITLRGVSS
jgi:hypothetical protein